jgi:predicted HicB family RNase H-like nuclease
MPKKKPADDTVTVRITEELRAKAKEFAARQRVSLLSVVNAAVTEYLKRKGA